MFWKADLNPITMKKPDKWFSGASEDMAYVGFRWNPVYRGGLDPRLYAHNRVKLNQNLQCVITMRGSGEIKVNEHTNNNKRERKEVI